MCGGRRRREQITFTPEGFRLKPVKTLLYLKVTIDEKVSFGLHFIKVTVKVEKKVASLAQVMSTLRKGRY